MEELELQKLEERSSKLRTYSRLKKNGHKKQAPQYERKIGKGPLLLLLIGSSNAR